VSRDSDMRAFKCECYASVVSFCGRELSSRAVSVLNGAGPPYRMRNTQLEATQQKV